MPTLTIGLDIVKNVFQVYGVDRGGRPVMQRKLRRADVLKLFSKLESSLVGIEACHGSHFWARELTSLGQTHGAPADNAICEGLCGWWQERCESSMSDFCKR